jgi:phosphoglucomutase
MDHHLEYDKWLERTDLDESLRKELNSFSEDDIKDRFSNHLEFGTGGLRALMGLGTNRINIYTIRKATQGLSNYLIKKYGKEKLKVVIAYDTRKDSYKFAYEAAKVLAYNKITAYIFEEVKPTPILSFAVRELKANAGIVVTASHNPPEYNGYKVYGEDGGQITLEAANLITEEISKTELFMNYANILNEILVEENINIVPKEVEDEYFRKIRNLDLYKKKSIKSKVKIVYSSLHGTGFVPVVRCLKENGFEDVYVVESQKNFDDRFSTVEYPNPEDPNAFRESLKVARKIDADLIFTTDPDCDRLGVMIKDQKDEYILLTGSQVGALLLEFILSNKKNISENDIVIKTIVTSDLGKKIALDYGASVWETLTGFKYIGEKINEIEFDKNNIFLFGYEESMGYLFGDFVRDKDAVISSFLVASMAEYYLDNGISLYRKIVAIPFSAFSLASVRKDLKPLP